jgi:hypothetical protein
MESHFGHDFSAVRVHTDSQATQSAAAVAANAYTVGRHIVMGPDKYQPGSPTGLRLLAHELTHAVQQQECGDPSDRLMLGNPNASAEHEAGQTADAVVSPTTHGARGFLRRQFGDPLHNPNALFLGPAAAGAVRSVSSELVQRECIEESGQPNYWKYEYDGCSLPAKYALSVGEFALAGAAKDNPAGAGNTAFALGVRTTKGGVACDRHDECYQSCTTNKDQCDSRMLADMNEICAKASPYVRQRCFAAALLYYQGLKQLPQAQKAFDDRKAQVCACDPDLIPPALRFPPLELLRSPRGGYLSWLDYQLNPRLVGYKAFRDQEQYERYLRSAGTPSEDRPTRDESEAPKTLQMR